MAFIVKTVSHDKAMSVLETCREAGLVIDHNRLSNIIRVYSDGVPILTCNRLGEDSWSLEYNDQYWEEIPADDEQPEPSEPEEPSAPE